MFSDFVNICSYSYLVLLNLSILQQQRFHTALTYLAGFYCKILYIVAHTAKQQDRTGWPQKWA